MLIFSAVCSLFVRKDSPDPRRFGFYRRLLTALSRLIFFLGRVKVEFRGGELLPAGGCMLAQNHLSSFDPIALYTLLGDRPLSFVSKRENTEIPVFGRLMLGAGVMPLDRDNDRQGILVMKEAAARIGNGHRVCIYPEGTRSLTGELGPFRNGCFKAALWAKAPMAVITVRYSGPVKENLFRRETRVTVTVRRVFAYEELEKLRTDEIGALVREEMLKNDRPDPV